jgi:hypothetical protein
MCSEISSAFLRLCGLYLCNYALTAASEKVPRWTMTNLLNNSPLITMVYIFKHIRVHADIMLIISSLDHRENLLIDSSRWRWAQVRLARTELHGTWCCKINHSRCLISRIGVF